MMSASDYYGRGRYYASANITLHWKESRVLVVKTGGAGESLNVIDKDAPTPPIGGPLFYIYNSGPDTFSIKDESSTIVNLPMGSVAKIFHIGGRVFKAIVKVSGTPTSIGLKDAFVPGGQGGATTNYKLETMTGVWSSVAASPLGRTDALAVVIGERFYVVGTSASSSAVFHSYIQNAWSTRASIGWTPEKLCGGMVNGKMLAISGDNDWNVASYNPLSNVWTNKANIPLRRNRASAEQYGTKIFVINGSPIGMANICYEPEWDAWITFATQSTTIRADITTFRIGDELFAIGGWNDSAYYSSDVEAYNIRTKVWSVKTSLGSPIYRAAGCSVNHRGTIFGGRDSGGAAVSNVWDYVLGTWTALAALPAARADILNHGVSII